MMVNNGSGWWFQPTPEKNMKVSWEYDIHNIWKVKKCSKPPTRIDGLSWKIRQSDQNG